MQVCIKLFEVAVEHFEVQVGAMGQCSEFYLAEAEFLSRFTRGVSLYPLHVHQGVGPDSESTCLPWL